MKPSLWSNVRLGFHLLYRERNSYALRMLTACVFVGVFAMTFMNVLHNQAYQLVYDKASSSFGADVILSSHIPLSAALKEQAENLKLESVDVATLFTMAKSKDILKLINLKAVAHGYPLKGALQLGVSSPFKETNQSPKAGEVWVEKEVLSALKLTLNDTITVGGMSFKITQVIARDGSTFNLLAIAPRLLMAITDLEKTKIIQPGSRVSYELWIKGEPSQVTAYLNQIKDLKNPDIEISLPSEGDSAIQRFIRFAADYLGVMTVCSVILTALGLSLGLHYWLQRRGSSFVLYQILGLSPKQLFQIVAFGLLIWLSVISTLAMLCAAGLAFTGLQIQTFIPIGAVSLSINPFLLSVAFVLIMFIGIIAPEVLKVTNQIPARFLQNPKSNKTYSVMAYGIMFVVCFVLLYFYLNNLLLTLMLGAGIGWSVLLSYLMFQLGLWCVSKLSVVSLSMTYALRQLRYRGAESSSLGIIITLSVFVFYVLTGMQSDILKQWQQSLTEKTPNHFIINIAPNDLPHLKALLKNYDIPLPDFYPILRGRLSHINGVAVAQDPSEEGPRGINRALNLTWMARLPEDNRLLKGAPWDLDLQKDELSIEQGFAERIGVSIGDRLTFSIEGQSQEARIKNSRSVQWQSFKPNFFAIFSPGSLDSFGVTYLCSFYLNPTQDHVALELSRNFPEVTLLKIGPLIDEVRTLLNWFSKGVLGLLLVVLGVSLMIVVLLFMASKPAREKEASFLRLLGASKGLVLKVLLVEFVVLAFVGAGVGVGAGNIMLRELSARVFDLGYQMNIQTMISTMLIVVVLVVSFGWLLYRRIPNQSPLLALRSD